MNDLVRPSHYMAYHEIVELRAARPARGGRWTSWARSARRATSSRSTARCPALERGERLAVLGAGAYGFVMASNYNTRPRPAEVMVDGGALVGRAAAGAAGRAVSRASALNRRRTPSQEAIDEWPSITTAS